MDAVRVALLREVLAGTQWPAATRRFGAVLRGSVLAHGGGLLLVGSEEYEPWHLAAHLADEAAWSGTPELAPLLVRHHVRAGDPARLSAGLGRIAAARRGETLLVASPDADAALLERVADARRAGVTVLALGPAEDELTALSHERLPVPDGSELDLDTVQHLVSAAAGECGRPARGRRSLRARLSRLAESLTAPPPPSW